MQPGQRCYSGAPITGWVTQTQYPVFGWYLISGICSQLPFGEALRVIDYLGTKAFLLLTLEKWDLPHKDSKINVLYFTIETMNSVTLCVTIMAL